MSTVSPESAAPLNAGSGSLSDLAQRDRFLQALAQGLADGSATRVLLSKPSGKDDDLERVTARPLVLRGERVLSLVFKHRTKDITRKIGRAHV